MGVKSSSTRRTSAASAISGQIVAINSPSGGVSVAGGRITATTPVSLGVVTAGQSSAATVVAAAPNPVVTSLLVTDSNFNVLDDTAFSPEGGYAKVIGKNFKAGAVAYINGVALVTAFISTTELNLTVPASATGSYSLMVFNPDNTGAIYLGLGISNLPTFTTPADSLAAFYETQAITASVSAIGDNPITYTLYSGSLPEGATLATDGTITGTSPVAASTTVYTFVIKASDAQNQDTFRSFSLTINPDVVSWISPNTIIDIDGSDIGSIALSATAATGNTVSYAVDSLPNGLSYSNGSITGAATVEGTTVSTLTATAAITNRSAVRYVTWTVSLGDTYWNNTTLLLNAQNNALPFNHDASLNNAQLTIAGDTKPSNFSPYKEGYYSNYFDGSGDSLTLTATVATVGTGNFTTECWIYRTSSVADESIFVHGVSGASGYGLGVYGQKIRVRTPSVQDNSLLSSGTITPGLWYHIALVRDSNTTTLYVNGASQLSFVDSSNETATVWNIGHYGSNNYVFSGYISNLRVVKGTALYTSAFTPSTEPLTNVANTVLLTCQSNRLIDNSVNNFAITKGGDTKVSSAIPFATPTAVSSLGSAYFDGTGDYLTAPANPSLILGAGDYTVEAWVYLMGTQTTTYGWGVIGTYPGGGTGWSITINRSVSSQGVAWILNGSIVLAYATAYIPVNTWTHIAITRSGSGTNNTKIFLNGVNVSQGTDNTNDTFSGLTYIGGQGTGQLFTGYISDARVIKGTALYTANFLPPQAPLTPVANTQLLTCQYNGGANNNGFVDQSSFNNIISRTGNPTQGTFSPFSQNGWSNYFGGSGNYLATPATHNVFAAANENYTLECWIYLTSAPGAHQMLCGWGTSPFDYVEIASNGLGTNMNNTYTVGATYTWSIGVWYHIAISRISNINYVFINGQLIGTGITNSASFGRGTAALRIGDWSTTPAYPFPGYISNFRFLKGTGLYSESFTPSTTALTHVANTQLLTCQSNRFIDNSPNNYALTLTGAPTVQAHSPFGGQTSVPTSYSNYFNGTSDYITFTGTSDLAFGTGNFTVECWIYRTITTVTNHPIFTTGYGGGTGSDFFLNLNSTFNVSILVGGSAAITGTLVVPVNTWTHVAVVKNSNTTSIYINGILDTSASDTRNYTQLGTFGIGYANRASTLRYGGFISNLRVVKGTALYTSNFTPSTTPLTTTSQGATASQVSLLTCQSATMVDNSLKYFTLTAAGDVKPRPFNPFGTTTTTKVSYSPSVNGGSMYFDGTGDYLTTTANDVVKFGADDYTIETWVYADTVSDAKCVFTTNPGTGFTHILRYYNATGWQLYFPGSSNTVDGVASSNLAKKGWVHHAIVRSGGTLRWYINGTQVYSGANSTNVTDTVLTIGDYAGYYWHGYISDFKVTKGVGLYTSNFYPGSAPATPTNNTVLLLNGSSGGVVDAHGSNNLETVGNTTLASETPYGGSYYSNYISAPTKSVWKITGAGTPLQLTNDFTIEFWMYLTDMTVSYMQVLNNSGGNGDALKLQLSGGLARFYFTNGTSYTYTPYNIQGGKWYHVVWERSGTSSTIFLNGVRQTVFTTMTATVNYSTNLFWGSGTASEVFYGSLSNLRIIKGQCLYDISQSTLEVPTSPLTAISGTSLLTCQSNQFKDNSVNNYVITLTDTPRLIKSMNPFQSSTKKSVYFPGAGSVLLPGDNFPSGAGSAFTMEFWILPTTLDNIIFRCNGNASSIGIYTNASGQIILSNTYVADFLTATGGALKLGQWNHVAITRTAANLYTVYLDGVSVGTATYATALGVQPMYIGYSTYTLAYNTFYMKDLRITKGVARTITVPTAPLKAK